MTKMIKSTLASRLRCSEKIDRWKGSRYLLCWLSEVAERNRQAEPDTQSYQEKEMLTADQHNKINV